MLNEKKEWLTLSQAAELLGVHPSTVRLWSDKGRIPVHRTQGNHRRYVRSEVEQMGRAVQESSTVEPENLARFAMHRIRFKIDRGQLESESWYQLLNEDTRDQYRKSGRYLVQGLTRYLESTEPGNLTEAHAIGYEYATRGRRSHLDIVGAAQAFLFFREALMESLIAVYQEAWVPTGGAWGDVLTRTLAFTDQILLTLMETYRTLEDNHK